LHVRLSGEEKHDLDYYEGFLGVECKQRTTSGFFASETFKETLLEKFADFIKPPPTPEERIAAAESRAEMYYLRNIELSTQADERTKDYNAEVANLLTEREDLLKQVSLMKDEVTKCHFDMGQLAKSRSDMEAIASSIKSEILGKKAAFLSLKDENAKLQAKLRAPKSPVVTEAEKNAVRLRIEDTSKLLAEALADKVKLTEALVFQAEEYRADKKRAGDEAAKLRALLAESIHDDKEDGFYDEKPNTEDTIDGVKETTTAKNGVPDEVLPQSTEDYIASLIGTSKGW